MKNKVINIKKKFLFHLAQFLQAKAYGKLIHIGTIDYTNFQQELRG